MTTIQGITHTDELHTSGLGCFYGGCVSVSSSAMPRTNGERVSQVINAKQNQKKSDKHQKYQNHHQKL